MQHVWRHVLCQRPVFLPIALVMLGFVYVYLLMICLCLFICLFAWSDLIQGRFMFMNSNSLWSLIQKKAKIGKFLGSLPLPMDSILLNTLFPLTYIFKGSSFRWHVCVLYSVTFWLLWFYFLWISFVVLYVISQYGCLDYWYFLLSFLI